MIVFMLSACAEADVPDAAHKHRRTLVRSAHYALGIDAPIATLAAQVHQESRWITSAISQAGAQGLAQFMPATAAWMPSVDASLVATQPYNPAWSLRAMAVYDKWLLDRVAAANECERWAFALAAYNGGLGWVFRDKKLASAQGADKLVFFGNVERFNAGRKSSAFRENRYYPQLILSRHEAVYAGAGWGRGVCPHRWPL